MMSRDMLIFETMIGSHMWKMNHAGSDEDYFRCYVMDSDRQLLGIRPKNKQTQMDGVDAVTVEIGQVIEQLKKGNINYVWNVTSPIVKFEYDDWLTELREITIANLSKLTHHSIRGLATHNIKHFLERKKYEVNYYKKLNIIGRTIMFGIYLLEGKGVHYLPTAFNNISSIYTILDKLTDSLKTSNLPDKPNPDPFNDYLIRIRKWKLRWDGYE